MGEAEPPGMGRISTPEATGAGAGAADRRASEPPTLEETPGWFQDQFHERQERRRTHERATRSRWFGRLRKAALAGAFAAPFLSMISMYLNPPYLGASVLVGGLAGWFIADRELTAPGAAIVYGGVTVSLSMGALATGWATGAAVLHPFTWLALTCAGVLIAQTVESDRLENLPY